jgi:hypothetical protein
MKFLPYERFRIRTVLSKQEVLKRLDTVIEPKQFLRLFGIKEKPYEGKIEDSHFAVSRIIWYSDPFLPMIKGDVESEMNGSSICISMQLRILVLVYMIIWLGIVGFFFLAILGLWISSLGQTSEAEPIFLILGGMFVFVYTLILGDFKLQSVESKKFFQDLFEAEEVEELEFPNPFWKRANSD